MVYVRISVFGDHFKGIYQVQSLLMEVQIDLSYLSKVQEEPILEQYVFFLRFAMGFYSQGIQTSHRAEILRRKVKLLGI